MLPAPLHPFEPKLAEHVPEGPDWITQIKWDGVRMLIYGTTEEVRLFNRKKNERTAQYPEFLELRQYCEADSVILDGEIIALEDGLPSFHQVMRRDGVRVQERVETAARTVPVVYMVFDLLYLNGHWVTGEPLERRQELLTRHIIPGPHLQLVPSVTEGAALFQAVSERGMEGVVSKQRTSTYAPGAKDGRWVKIKHDRDLIAAVGGMTLRGPTANALLLGLFDAKGRFLYIGHAGAGRLTGADWGEFTKRAAGYRQPRCPFANLPARSRDAIWLAPFFTVKLRYLEWTRHGTLRHPTIQAFVDVPAASCLWPLEETGGTTP
ncbi:RNA ligase family protein [Gorillibacterium sp. CAU 1737]|uniref:ATP-dependent DNA ligase n=1 Tax=Gorillibacterium sp. CAU 1737 TaxID=3140362 RepID=UPI0032615AE9